MRKLEVFFHLYVPFSDAAGLCVWWIDSVLQKIRDSGLANVAQINMGITMPMHINSTNKGVPIKSNISKLPVLFHEGLTEYLNMRYPWVNILDIRDISLKNIYEGQTLDLMYRYSSPDADILYIHNKGVYSTCFHSSVWREVLEHYMINEWRKCVSKLDNNDLILIKDSHIINSGNVYWVKGKYLKSLENPLESNKYLPPEKTDMYPDSRLFRYAFELWITSKNPKVDFIHEIKCNPYDSFWFLERTLNK